MQMQSPHVERNEDATTSLKPEWTRPTFNGHVSFVIHLWGVDAIGWFPPCSTSLSPHNLSRQEGGLANSVTQLLINIEITRAEQKSPLISLHFVRHGVLFRVPNTFKILNPIKY